jgi:hypothetical protein
LLTGSSIGTEFGSVHHVNLVWGTVNLMMEKQENHVLEGPTQNSVTVAPIAETAVTHR